MNPVSGSRDGLTHDGVPTAAAIQRWLVDWLARKLGLPASKIELREPFSSYGLGSVQAVEVMADLEQWLGARLSPTLAWEYPDVESLSRFLAEGARTSAAGRLEAVPLQDGAAEPIAIIGMACRFPGATGIDAYWDLLVRGIDAIREVPPERWDIDDYYDPDLATPGKMITRNGGFIDHIDQFDAPFFGISPREAASMDPQQRLLMQAVWEALESAGQDVSALSGSRVGVFVGMSHNDYGRMQMNPAFCDPHMLTGNAGSIAANRISYRFNFHGPSLTTDTACSSSLVATHLACRSIWNGESAMAIVGSACLMLSPTITINFSKAGMLSPDGRCKAFDASANGFARGEGAAAVVLKPLARALQDGDPIWAVVRGSAVNSDGRTNGITAPSREAQEAVIRTACAVARVSPAEVGYVEAHGTGTPLGDPIEAKALGSVLGNGRPIDQPLLIGSAKTNIGHLESVSGLAGLIKAALSLKHGVIPPSLHFNKPNPHIPFEDLRLRVQTQLGPWPESVGPRLAGVNSFGFGGANAHVVLQEPPREPAAAGGAGERRILVRRPFVMAASAKTPEALASLAESYAGALRNIGEDGPSLLDACYTANVRRTHHEHRMAVVARTASELVGTLEAFGRGERKPGVVSGVSSGDRRGKIAFVFPGQGSQWWAMGRTLLEREPVFRVTMDKCDDLFRRLAGWSIRDALLADETGSRLNDTEVAQPAVFSLQVALAALWRSWGIVPDAVIGHSMGEVAAAHVAGILSFEDAVTVIYHRGRLMQQATGKGRMAVVGMSFDEAQRLLDACDGRVSIAAVNGPESLTLSGETDAVERLLKQLDERQVFHKLLPVNYAFHSPQMRNIALEITEALGAVQPRPLRLPMYSTLTGGPLDGAAFDADYWGRNVAEPVRFLQAVDGLLASGHHFFIELSPQPTLAGDIRRRLRDHRLEGLSLTSLTREGDDQVNLLLTLATLHTAGWKVDWRRLYPEGRRCVSLPSYPWQTRRHWVDHTEESIWTGAWRGPGKRDSHPLISGANDSAHPCVEVSLHQQRLPYLADHRVQGAVTAPAAAFIEMALAASTGNGHGHAVIEDMAIHKPLFLASEQASRLQVILTPETEDRATFQIYSMDGERGRNGNGWNLHVTGRAVFNGGSNGGSVVRLDPIAAIRARCDREKDTEGFYATLKKVGLDYGPHFRGVRHIWWNDAEAIARIEAPEAVVSDVSKYHLHPALLDACIQALAPLVPGAEESGSLYVPVNIGKVRVYRAASPTLWCYARLIAFDRDTGLNVEVDLVLLDEQGNPIAEISSLRAQRIDSDGTRPENDADSLDWLYEIAWERQSRPGEYEPPEPAGFLPDAGVLASVAETALARLGERHDFNQYCRDAADANAELGSAFILAALRGLGWTPAVGETVTTDSLLSGLRVAPRYQRLFVRLLQVLALRGVLAPVGAGWTVLASPDPGDPAARSRQVAEEKPALQTETSLLARCGSRLADVLRGECDPRPILFPEGSTEELERLYQDAAFARVYNGALKQMIQTAIETLPPGRTLRVLELGAGTGSTTSYLLPVLTPHRVEYVFTDVSGLFLVHAEQKFAEYPFVSYRTLDIEKDPIEQGFQPLEFDIIIGANVLHATSDLRRSLGNARRLLNPGGHLILLESTAPSETFDLIFGLLDELWRFQDTDLRNDYMLLPQRDWLRVLEDSGFINPVSAPAGENAPRDPAHQTLLIARGPGVVIDPTLTEKPALAPRECPGTWLLLTKESPRAGDVGAALTARGETCICAFPGAAFQDIGSGRYRVRPASAEDFSRLVAGAIADPARPLRGVLHLWNIGDGNSPARDPAGVESAQVELILTMRELIRALEAAELDPPPKIWIGTRGAQDVSGLEGTLDVAAAPAWGLGRAIALEHWKLRPALVDFPPTPAPDEAEWLVRELWADLHEDQIALRAGRRYVKRLIREAEGAGEVSAERLVTVSADTPYALTLEKPGAIDSVCLRAVPPRTPHAGEVLVRVAAAGVNFRDVMKVLGIYPMAPGDRFWLGDECAGTIAAVGPGVAGFRPGDSVMVIGPDSFSSFVVAPVDSVIPMPPALALEQAAGLPSVFLTAYYALHYVARLEKGERVLIHAAAGGVGLAAIQMARRIGAEIFATAGTPEKRDLLRSFGVKHLMNSRSLDFADEIMRLTGGEGIDVVLNSLSGDAIPKSLSLLRAHGRFIEIGKRDIYENSRVGLAAFKRNQSFHAIDLQQVFRDRPVLARRLLDEVMALVRSGELQPLPVQAFPVSEAADAFRHMAQAKHTGKVVLSFTEPTLRVKPHKDAALTLPEAATYLITGGLGGFGLAVAQWIVEKGARNLALIGRSGASRPEAAEALAQFKGRGVNAMAFAADVADAKQMDAVFETIQKTMPPLRGIIHSAMVLDDVSFLEMTDDRFWNVFRPKADGAWNLHVLSRECPLDFFVMFSSASSIVGGPGQANYGSANEYLNTFAHFRRAQGLPATAINFGRLGDVGYVAEHEKVGELLDRYGIQVMPLRATLTALERILIKQPVQIGLMKMDWDLLRTLHPAGLDYPLLLRLRSHAGHGVARTHGGINLREVAALPLDQQLRRLETHIQHEIARVLQMDPATVDVGVPLTSLGLDSLVGIELRARLETDLRVKMPMTLLMQGPSISGLAAYFLEELNGAAAGHSTPPKEVLEIEVSKSEPERPLQVAAVAEREVVEL